ncbi:MAG: ribonuclease, partial [Stenotrophomonas nitritireducens]|nr:ribonuclease [Stenotrophomonas nitritireducens]
MRKPLLLLTAAILLVAGLWAMRALQQPPPPQFAPSLDGPAAPAVTEEPRQPGATDPLPAFLPPEAHDTIALVLRGGPFPHRQDGSVFGNRERRLPQRPRG